MKENLIKKERNVKETIALVTGMFANIQDSLKDDRVRYRIFEDAYDARKVLYFQMLEKSEFVNYKVVEIQDKDIVTFKLFLQTYGDDKLICEYTIIDRYKLSIKYQTDNNISKETDIKSKEDKKEDREDILRIFRMFKKIDEYFMLGYFIGNGVYPLLEKSAREFLNLCDKVWRQISPIYPSQAPVTDPNMVTILSEFHKLVDITLAKTISEVSSRSSDTFTSYIHLLRDTLTTKFPELSSDNITEDLYLHTMSYRRLIEFAVDYITTQVDAMLSSCKDVKKLRENYIKLNNLFKITKQAAEQADLSIYESERVDEKLKEFSDKVDSFDTTPKEDKKEYPEYILNLVEMFKKIDVRFMLGFFDRNEVYPLLKTSIGEFLVLCDCIATIVTPSVIIPNNKEHNLVQDFKTLVYKSKTCYDNDTLSSKSLESSTDYIYILRYIVMTEFSELVADIRDNLNVGVGTALYNDLIDCALKYITTQVYTMLSCKDIKNLRKKYIKLNNLFKITKQAAKQMDLIIDESVDEKLKDICDYIDKESKAMNLLLVKFIDTITHFNLNISDEKIKAEMDKSDDNFIEYTLKIFSDNMRKIQEDPTKDTFKKDMKMLMSLGECIVVANHENNKRDGFTSDIPAANSSIRLRSIAQENKIKENKKDTKMNKEKDIFAPIDWTKEIGTSIDLVNQIDWEKEFEQSYKERLKSLYCCKEPNLTSLYPAYVTVTERPNWHDEHISILQPLDAKKPATKVIAHIVAHMNNVPISKDTIVESFIDQFCNINVNIYDNSGESPKTLVTRTYAPGEYTVTELGCGYAVGIYSTKYNKNESKDYYIPYKKKC